MKSPKRRRRSTRLVLVLGVMASVLMLPATAMAGIDGGCTGSVVIEGTTYGPNNDTVGNPIVVPIEKDGVVAIWEGKVPFDNENNQGELGIVVGPFTINIATWGDANTANKQGNSGSYSIEEFKDLFPVPESLIPRGVYQLSGEHSADGGRCTGTVMVKLEGSGSIGIATVVGAAITFVTMLGAGLRRKS
ncbi:MAG: hypothetical protein OEM81_06475 [Acidimicrobiia bacterium]|nr:hypothetical protein [Acidimicrobiia bacterium]MDH3397466.1 hypothetical protein [Acidimicrobiia bacterium]